VKPLKYNARIFKINRVMAAFRYTEEGRSLLITGDTVKSANVQKFAGDVDLLVHEALATNLVEMAEKVAEKTGNSSDVKMMHGIRDYPTSPLEAAETARDSGIEHLLCRHTVPPLVFLEQKMLLLNGAELFFQITRLASMVWPFHCGRIRMKSFATVKGCSQA
jgi:ribonuclease Z